MSEEIKKGLLGIVVDETTISHVVPELSALTYRGYTVQELCDKCDFEEVAYLVLNGELPNKNQLKKFINPNLFIDNMLKNDVKLISMGDNKLRVVTHLDYNQEQHEYFIEYIDKIHYKMFVNNPISFNESSSIDSITKDLNAWLEKMILKNPSQWIWSHNRWK